MRKSGVGWQSAIRLVLELGDIDRFRTTDALPHYLGLTPSQYSSGELDHRGHTLKCGPGLLRALLLQCAWSAVRHGGDPDSRNASPGWLPVIGRKRAIVAVARKLAIKLRRRWRTHLLPGEARADGGGVAASVAHLSYAGGSTREPLVKLPRADTGRLANCRYRNAMERSAQNGACRFA